MVHTCWHESLNDRQRPLPASRIVLEPCPPLVQNRLPGDGPLFVEVHERLVLRVVGEHPGVDANQAWRPRERDTGPKADGLPIRQRLGNGPPLGDDDAVVHCQSQAGAQELRNRCVLRLKDRRIEQPCGRVDLQLVCDVDRVSDEGDVERRRFDVDVEVGKGHGMRFGPRGASEQPHDNSGDPEALHRANGSVNVQQDARD
jgi:hypothetical protein